MQLKTILLLIKKLIPSKNGISTVDTSGDGKADSIQINIINKIFPFLITKTINFGDYFDIKNVDFMNYVEFSLDDQSIDISKEILDINAIRERVKIYLKGIGYTIDDILQGKAKWVTIGLGDKISILIKMDSQILEKFTEGKHIFKIKHKNNPLFEIDFELTSKNMNVRF